MGSITKVSMNNKEDEKADDLEHCSIRKRYGSKEYPNVYTYVKGMKGKYGQFFKAEIRADDHLIITFAANTLHMIKVKSQRFMERFWVTIGTAMMAARKGDKMAMKQLKRDFDYYDVSELVQDIIRSVRAKAIKKQGNKPRTTFNNNNGGKDDWK